MQMQQSGQSPFEWWFRLTAPTMPANPTFAQRETVRRGREASITAIAITLYGFAPTLQAMLAGNISVIITTGVSLLINFLVLVFFNRRGNLTISGIIIIGGMLLGFVAGQVTSGITAEGLRGFDLLASSLLVGVAFFPPQSVFVIMAFNIVFTVFWLLNGAKSADVVKLVQDNAYTVFFPPIVINLFVGGLTFLRVRSEQAALREADRSQEIVDLERRELQQQQEQISMKDQLEEGMQQLLKTHAQAANGNFSARVPLSKDNVLWRVAYSLNNLLARLEKMNSVLVENDHTRQALQDTTRRIQQGQPLQRTGLPDIDALILSLRAPSYAQGAPNNMSQGQPTPQQPQPQSSPMRGPLQQPASNPLGSPLQAQPAAAQHMQNNDRDIPNSRVIPGTLRPYPER